MICCCEGRNGRILKSLYGAFHCIDVVIVWLNELKLAFFFRKKLFDVFFCLIIHNVEFWLEPFLRKLVKICFIGVEDASIIQPGNRHGHDGICFIMVNDQESHAPIKRHKREVTPQVIVNDSQLSVSECAEAKHVCDRLIVIIADHFWSWTAGGTKSLGNCIHTGGGTICNGWVTNAVVLGRVLLIPSRPLHVAFHCCWAWVEILED